MRRSQSAGPKRRALLKVAAAAALGAGGISGYLSRALAAARVPMPGGVRQVQGDVRINNRPAAVNQLVQPGDVVTTGKGARAVIVIGRDAYLLRANTRFEVRGQLELREPDGRVREAVVEALHVLNGAVLAVFGKGNKRIELPQAVLGIRGTGVYVEAGRERSYVCTCYGQVEISVRQDPGVSEVVSTRHHEAPRYVSGGAAPRIEKAPVRDHTDAELVMLEDLVGREPPFDVHDPFYSPY